MPGRIALPFRDRVKAEPYANALRGAGLEPLLFPPEEPEPIETCQGLVLMGGTDVDPALYGEEPHPETQAPDRVRDAVEQGLVREALAAGKPVLAICRGLQLFNVVHGGSLIQHLPEAGATHRVPREPDVHPVEIVPESLLARILGERQLLVNSRHHQAVNRVGSGLVVSGRAPDGVVEALERPDKPFAIAVQWHPEDRIGTHPADRRLFAAFAEAVARSWPR